MSVLTSGAYAVTSIQKKRIEKKVIRKTSKKILTLPLSTNEKCRDLLGDRSYFGWCILLMLGNIEKFCGLTQGTIYILRDQKCCQIKQASKWQFYAAGFVPGLLGKDKTGQALSRNGGKTCSFGAGWDSHGQSSNWLRRQCSFGTDKVPDITITTTAIVVGPVDQPAFGHVWRFSKLSQ